MPRTTVFDHFDGLTDGRKDGNHRATCKHCGTSVSGSKKATSNFVRHLKKDHPDVYGAPSHAPHHHRWDAADPRQVKMTNSIIQFIANDLIPPSVVESAAFRNIFQAAEPRFTMPSRKHVSQTLVPLRASSVRDQLIGEIQKIPNLYLTVDLWSSRDTRSIIGITGHFIVDYTLKSVMLACRRFKGAHTAENIFRTYEEAVEVYSLTEKVLGIVTDNAANMVKALTMFPVPVPDTDEDEDVAIEVVGIGDKLDYFPPENTPCFAHTLQLVVRDAMEQTAPYRQVLAKFSRIIAHSCKSTQATKLLEGHCTLQIANAARWNGQLKILKAMLKVPVEELSKLHESCKLTTDELKIIGELCETLEPFEAVTDIVQSDGVITASYVITCVRGLRHAIALKSEASGNKMAATMKLSLEKRLSKFEKMECFQLAACLDPRFKLDWCTGEEVSGVRELLSRKVTSLAQRSADKPPNLPQNPKSELLMTDCASDERSSFATIDASVELSRYLSEPCVPEYSDPLIFWNEKQLVLPHLAKLACEHLALPASSAPVESLFSAAGKVFRPEQCNLSDAMFEELMLIRCNSSLE